MAAAPQQLSAATSAAMEDMRRKAEAMLAQIPVEDTPVVVESAEGLLDAVRCPICIEVMTYPKMLACGHSTCALCLAGWQEQVLGYGAKGCPTCRVPIVETRITDNTFAIGIIDLLPMRCRREGCTATFPYSNKDNHYNNTCPKGVIMCDNTEAGCGFTASRDEEATVMAAHMRVGCMWRPVACDLCGEEYPMSDRHIHNETCAAATVTCERGRHCRVTGTRGELTKHECPYDFGPFCPLKGCRERIRRMDVEEHLTSGRFYARHRRTIQAAQKTAQRKFDLKEAKAKEAKKVADEAQKELAEQNRLMAIVLPGASENNNDMDNDEAGSDNGGEGPAPMVVDLVSDASPEQPEQGDDDDDDDDVPIMAAVRARGGA
jgi:hypothetical protein